MAEAVTEELDIEEFKIKEEIVSIKEKNLPSCIVEETCTENADIKGEFDILQFSTEYIMFHKKKYYPFL